MWLPTFFTFNLMILCIVQNSADAFRHWRKPNLNRIIGGTDSKPHAHPSILLMTIDGYMSCGGSILNEEWVISAAHCYDDTDDSKEYGFLAGRHNRSKEEASEQKVKAVKVIVHEGYTDDYQNDIALFKVTPKFQFNDKVKATVLAPKDWDGGKGNAIAVGWGKTVQRSNKGATVLQQVWLPLVNNEECQRIMDYIYDTNICAGTIKGVRDACQGDSGGPLYFKEKTGVIQIGIVSWGVGCGKRGNVGVYTRISKYLDWITAKISGKRGEDTGVELLRNMTNNFSAGIDNVKGLNQENVTEGE